MISKTRKQISSPRTFRSDLIDSDQYITRRQTFSSRWKSMFHLFLNWSLATHNRGWSTSPGRSGPYVTKQVRMRSNDLTKRDPQLDEEVSKHESYQQYPNSHLLTFTLLKTHTLGDNTFRQKRAAKQWLSFIWTQVLFGRLRDDTNVWIDK